MVTVAICSSLASHSLRTRAAHMATSKAPGAPAATRRNDFAVATFNCGGFEEQCFTETHKQLQAKMVADAQTLAKYAEIILVQECPEYLADMVNDHLPGFSMAKGDNLSIYYETSKFAANPRFDLRFIFPNAKDCIYRGWRCVLQVVGGTYEI